MSVTYVFDLDGTLCETPGTAYAQATPYPSRIAHVNRLYAAGHRVVIDTARGSGTGRDWYDLTVQQLATWGCAYSALYVGSKTPGDVYIDDRAHDPQQFFPHADA